VLGELGRRMQAAYGAAGAVVEQAGKHAHERSGHHACCSQSRLLI
jgi:hypothetical protein